MILGDLNGFGDVIWGLFMLVWPLPFITLALDNIKIKGKSLGDHLLEADQENFECCRLYKQITDKDKEKKNER